MVVWEKNSTISGITLQPTEVFSGDVLEFGTEVSALKIEIESGLILESWKVFRANKRLSGADDIEPHPTTEDPSEVIST